MSARLGVDLVPLTYGMGGLNPAERKGGGYGTVPKGARVGEACRDVLAEIKGGLEARRRSGRPWTEGVNVILA